ncbi:hypothetical protein [Streptomyces narbonensis]
MARDEIEHIRSERPASPVAALAARRGLGDRADALTLCRCPSPNPKG